MELKNMRNVDIKRNSLIIKDSFRQVLDYDNEEKIGILKELPDMEIVDIWCTQFKRKPVNWFEYMYNNSYVPDADIKFKYGRGVVAVGYLDSSNANTVKNIGSMKEIWKEYEKKYLEDLDLSNINIRKIEESFWDYYITNYGDKFNVGVEVLEAYIAKKRALMSEEHRSRERAIYPFLDDDDLWRRGCRDYLEYLIRVKTVRGFIVELILFKALEQLSGGDFVESNEVEERNGIDGYIKLNNKTYPICLKPYTYKGGGVTPIYKDRLVKYRKNGNDLVFYFNTGEDLLNEIQKIAV